MLVGNPEPHEVVVRMTASGVCHTDLSVKTGAIPVPPPTVLGHEGVGIVEAIGNAVSRVRVGDKVITTAAPACGACYFCVRGEQQSCERLPSIAGVPRFQTADGRRLRAFAGLGTFAEVMTSHELSLIPVRSDLPDALLGIVGCGVVTGVGAVVNTARVRPGQSVAIVGLGGVGQSALQAAVLSGASTVIAIDPMDTKRAAAVRLGASVGLAPGEHLVEAVKELTDGRGVDVAFEAVGSPVTMTAAWQITRRGGQVVFVGAPPSDSQITFNAADLGLSRKTIKSSIFAGGDALQLIPAIVDLAEKGKFDLEHLVTATIRLDAIEAAFTEMEQGRSTRSVITYD
jgi:S-(hydroxymethyl)glutathione dehydrogenase/alcohol dehydrogenase